MPLTITVDPPVTFGNTRRVRGVATFDNSYPTGGEPLTAQQLGLTFLRELVPTTGRLGTGSAYAVAWNRSTSAPTIQAFYGDNNNAADGPLIEAPATTDLSTLVVPFEAIGY
jgi:hypothetical protein